MSMEKNKKKKKNKGHVRNKECIGVKLKSQLKIKKIIRRILDLPTSYPLATLHNSWFVVTPCIISREDGE